jgi:N-acetylneuraminic acid mutarotase
MPVEIAEVAAAAVEDVIYTGGGFTPPGGAVGRWFGRYDVTDDAWEARTDLPQAVHHHQLAAAAGRVWLAGGYTGPLNRASASNQLHAYDPTADRWTRMADMPGRRAAGFLVAQTDRLWLVGGIGDAEDRMWVYEIATDSWSERPGPTPREHLGAAAWDGWVFAVAGRGFGRGNVGTLEGYDIAAERWATLPAMPGQCGGCSAAVTADGRIHVTGGEGGGRTYNDHYVYDIATAGWSVDQPMPTARHGIGAAAVGSRFYVIGGGRMQGLAYSNLVEWWEPAPASPTRVPWPTPTAGPSPTTDRTVTPPPFQTPSAFGFLPALLNGQP